MPDKFESFRITEKQSSFKNRRANNSKFYNGRKWRNFRANHKREQRKRDEKEIVLLYESDTEYSRQEYLNWIEDKEQRPLCREYLKEKRIVVADVLDHITRIEAGGEKFEHNNLQWLSHHKHNIKSARESHS